MIDPRQLNTWASEDCRVLATLLANEGKSEDYINGFLDALNRVALANRSEVLRLVMKGI